jgi:hypothetical protein
MGPIQNFAPSAFAGDVAKFCENTLPRLSVQCRS